MASDFLTPTNRIYRVTTLTDVSDVITPDVDTTDIGLIALDDDYTIDTPDGTPYDGQRLTLRVTQDGTGGRDLTWDSDYVFARAASAYLNPNPNSTSVFEFMYHGSAAVWRHLPDASWGVARGLLAYNERTTPYTGISSDGVGDIILTTSAQVEAGRNYQVIGHGEVEIDNNVDGRAESHIKFTTNGATPTVASSDLTRELSTLPETDIPATVHMVAIYQPATSHLLTVSIHCQGVKDAPHEHTYYATADWPIYISIEDVGPNLS